MKESKDKDKDKLIHDLNGDISTLTQSLHLMDEYISCDPELISKMIPLCVDKIEQIKKDWLAVKKLMK
ncbi:MAG: hypothetical protein KAG61_13075 [Bacteriovoracaceae bacterium]|nr:hypothetical protein [Bacteriovoracaceae bacterium]